MFYGLPLFKGILMFILDSTARTATGMDGTLPKFNFENLKPVEISKNSIGII